MIISLFIDLSIRHLSRHRQAASQDIAPRSPKTNQLSHARLNFYEAAEFTSYVLDIPVYSFVL